MERDHSQDIIFLGQSLPVYEKDFYPINIYLLINASTFTISRINELCLEFVPLGIFVVCNIVTGDKSIITNISQLSKEHIVSKLNDQMRIPCIVTGRAYNEESDMFYDSTGNFFDDDYIIEICETEISRAIPDIIDELRK